jgi:hypothetical protein
MTVISKNYEPTIPEKDLRVTDRAAKLAARVAGRSLKIRARGRRK